MAALIDRWWSAVQTKQTIGRSLGGSDRVFDGEDYIIRHFAELADECKISGALGNYIWTVSWTAGQKSARNIGHHAGKTCAGINDLSRVCDTKVRQDFDHDFPAGARAHLLLDEVPGLINKETVTPEDIDVIRLIDEVRLMRQDNRGEPTRFREGDKAAFARSIAGQFLDGVEE